MDEDRSPVPTSFCPRINGKCKRIECQLWVDDGETHGCSEFFIGVLAQYKLKKVRKG